ncbi:hypothetical protein [Mycobacterium uberis]|uniref:hypothetical protein n=1 Tax=Mycobacterium uberis TaxID=2162698 RepID=UPI000E30A729|nr:hypothetical protein [Mycobacterium uberis]
MLRKVAIVVGEQVDSDNARAKLEVLHARVATVPDAKDVAGTSDFGSSYVLGVTGVMGLPGAKLRQPAPYVSWSVLDYW